MGSLATRHERDRCDRINKFSALVHTALACFAIPHPFREFDMHLDAITLEGLTVSPAITGLSQRYSRKCDGAPPHGSPLPSLRGSVPTCEPDATGIS